MIKSEDANDPSVKKILQIAEKLGWKSIEIIPGHSILGHLYGTSPKGETVVPIPDWLDSLDACEELLEHIRGSFWSVQIFSHALHTNWAMVCVPYSGPDGMLLPTLFANGRSLQETICNMFLIWKGVLKNEGGRHSLDPFG